MSDYDKPLPCVHGETRPYWEGAKRHELMIPKCQDCGLLFFYPRSLCPHCMSDKIDWIRASGKGKVYTFTISHVTASSAFQEDVPYNIAIIELDEGVHLMSNIVGCKNEDIRIDMPVEVVFDDVTPEITLPRFRPVS